jgi:tetratricopeptide (TPR) repeat protein
MDMKLNDESGAAISIQVSLKQAQAYAKYGQHAEAIKIYEQILAVDPNNEDALVGKITSLRSRHQFAESEAETRQALEKFPKNAKFLNQDAELDFDKHQYEQAIKKFEQILKDYPENHEAWAGKIKSLRSLRHFPEAEQVMQEALKQLPQNVRILNEQGYLHADQQQHEAAIKAFSQVLSIDSMNADAFDGKIQALRSQGKWDQSNQAIEKMCDRPGNSSEMLNECAWLYFNQQQYDKAIQVCEQILTDVPNDEYAWEGKIDSLRQQSDFGKAAQAVQQALTQLPRSLSILNQQGYLYAVQQQHEAALKAFEQGLSIDPINVDAFTGKIQALRSQGKWDQSNQAIEKMLDRPGNSPEILNTCGWLYFNQKQYDKAIQVFEQTIKDFPYDEDAWVGKIASLRWQSDFDKAAKAIQEALTRLPQNVGILNQQGHLYADQSKYEKAIQVFQQTLNDHFNDEYTWRGKISSLRRMHRFTEAEEAAQKALGQLPQNITILEEKINLYRSQGQYDKIIAVCDEILKIDLANGDAFVQKIVVMRSLRRFPDAAQVIQEALTRLPQNVRILNQQGYLHLDQQQHAAALKAFKQVLSIVPLNADAFDGKIKALQSWEKWDEANQAIEEMCNRPGNSPEMLNQCGDLYLIQQQYDKAIQAYEQTLKDFPYDEDAWGGKIASLQWQSDFDNAEQAIQEARKWLPRSQHIQSRQILLHLHQRQYDRVIKDCQEILSNNPSHEIALWGTIEALREQSHFKDAGIKMNDALRKLQYSVRLLNQKGTLLLSQRRYKRAFLVFRQTLKINPIDEDAVIGQIRSKCQDYCFDEAEKTAQKFLQQPVLSRNTRILNEQGQLYLVEKKYADAIDVFVQILKFDPIDEDAWAGRISCQRLQGRLGEADQLIQKALRLLPNSARLLHEQGLLYCDRNQLELADDCFEQAFRQDPTWTKTRFCQVEVKRRMRRPWDALRILEELEKLFPDDVEVKARKGWWYLRRNQSQKAKEVFSAIDDKYEKTIEKNDGLRAVYFKQGDYKKAEEEAKKVLKTEPNNPYFLANLAQILLQQRQKSGIQKLAVQSIWGNDKSKRDEALDKAETLCKKALEKDRHSELVLGCLGAIAYEKGNLLETESYLLASIKENPRSGNYTSLGALYAHMGQDQKAKKNLEKAIEFDDDDTQAYLELGDLYLKTDVERAMITFEKALAIDKESAEPQQALAIAWMQKSEFDRAEKILRRALYRLDGRMHQQLRLSLVQLLIRRGDQSREQGDDALANQYYKDALKEAFKLKRLPPEQPEAYFFIGIIQFQLQDYKNALKSFKICLENARLDEDYYFDAERNASLTKIRIERPIIPRGEAVKIGYVLGFLFLTFLIVLWTHYFWYKQGTMNETTMMLMTTLFLGLIIVAFLLPALSRLKLPGGFEAELSKPTPSVGKGPTPDSITLSQPKSPITPKENRVLNLNSPRPTISPNQDTYGRN